MKNPLLAAVAVVILAGCGSSSPAAVVDGTYEEFAASDGASSEASLTISGSSFVLATEAALVEASLAESGPSFVVCPPDGEGEVRLMSKPFTIGGIDFSAPGVFGDCGETRPVRVTVVDVDSADPGLAFPFTEWVELCDMTDPDC
jgi:hypothetical protein